MLNEYLLIKNCLQELNKFNLVDHVKIDNLDRIVLIIRKLASKQNRGDLTEILYFAGLTY